MEAIRRNSKEFNLIKDFFEDHLRSASARKMIRLYSLRPGHDLDEAVLVNKVKKNAETIFNLFYLTVTEYLRDTSKKLFRKDDEPFYYFKSSSSSRWIEFPFELTGRLKQKVLRKKKKSSS